MSTCHTTPDLNRPGRCGITGTESLLKPLFAGESMKVNPYIKGAVRQFSYWFAHGTLGDGEILRDVDYLSLLKEESSFAEMAFTVFMNNLEYGIDGIKNYKQAEMRAAQYIRQYCDPSFIITPPLESWETDTSPVSKSHWNT